ncbi:MAG TPA: TonB-dependent receptor [Gammaproteobacteria bacterium]|nr:TonB-dependent receptor [Gammaproteobacteria bacterium]
MQRSALSLALAAAVALPAAAQEVETVVVTGSYIRRPSQFDSPSPLVSITADDLAATGANEVGRVLEDLTINTGSQNNPDAFTQNFTTGTTNVNLRGLGVSSTLVLINGRRQTQSAVTTDRGENFVDTSSLPPAIAYERIEVLKDGATALYGSEAVAGVVNFITRSRYEGFDLELAAQGNTEHPQQDLELSGLWGGGGEDTHVLVAFSYLDREPLTTYERRLSGPTDDLSQAGNPGSFLVPSLPGNPAYRSVWTAAFDSDRNGVADFVQPQLGLPAVAGAQPPVFADQNCTAIAAQDPKVVPAISVSVPSPTGAIPIGLCQFDFGGFYSIVPEETRASAFTEVTHSFGDRLEGRLEAHIANNEALRNNSPSFPFAAFPNVAASHPDNPYGSDVRFIGRIIGAGGVPIQSIHNSDTWRVAGSLNGSFGDSWDFDVAAQLSENDFFVSAPDVLVDRFNNAIRGLGGEGCNPTAGTPGAAPCVYFNPFGTSLTGTGTRNSPELFDYLIGFEQFDAHSELTSVEGVVSRELGSMGGGPAGMAVGAQYRGDELTYDYDENANRDNFLFLVGNPDFGDKRDINAVFVEFALPFSETLNLQLAGRYEDYGDGVDSTDPKATLLWRPSTAVALRASVGTAFRAPSLFQAFGTQTTLAELIDPRVGSPQFFPVRTQPNPSGATLSPEEADVFNVGVSFSPTEAWEIGLDYWAFDYTNVIIEQNAQAILNAAAQGNTQAQSQVIRDPTSGLLLRVDSYYANASSLETDGVDLSVSRELSLRSGGSLRVGADTTYIMNYDLQDPQAGTIEGAGRRNFANFGTSTPEWKGNLFVTWQTERHAVNAFVRYIDSYVDDEVDIGQGSAFFRPIDSQVTLDAQYALTLSAERAPKLTFGVINATDEDPPRVQTSGGYDSKVHDPRGRMVYAKALFRF